VIEALEAEIGAANVSLLAAFNSASSDRLLMCYLENAVLVPPGEPPTVGHDAMRRRWDNMFGSGRRELSLETSSVQRLTVHAAIELGSYTQRHYPDGTELGDEHGGSYLVLWNRHRGAWRIAVDIWNLSEHS
jgi:ketosteroid isomerase-like protein